MNGPDPYDRRLNRMPEQVAPSPAATGAPETPALAARRDPSQPSIATSQQTADGIAWVRPTELFMRVGSPAAGRGIDLQTALAARARRAPASLAGAGRRTTRSAIARPTTTVSHEGMEM